MALKKNFLAVFPLVLILLLCASCGGQQSGGTDSTPAESGGEDISTASVAIVDADRFDAVPESLDCTVENGELSLSMALDGEDSRWDYAEFLSDEGSGSLELVRETTENGVYTAAFRAGTDGTAHAVFVHSADGTFDCAVQVSVTVDGADLTVTRAEALDASQSS